MIFDKNGAPIQKGSLIKFSSKVQVPMYKLWNEHFSASVDGLMGYTGETVKDKICLVLETHYRDYGKFETEILYILYEDKKVYIRNSYGYEVMG